MRSYLVMLFLIAGYCAVAQTEKKAKITGSLETCPDGTRVVLFEPYSGETDSTETKSGKFTLNMPLPHGGSMYILLFGKDMNNPKSFRLIYLGEGDMYITGKGPYLTNAKFTGPDWVADWQEAWQLVDPNSTDEKRYVDLLQRYRQAVMIGDEETADAAKMEGEEIEKEREAKVTDWVKKHPNSPISAYLITCYIKAPNKRKAMLNELGEGGLHSRIARRYLHPGKYEPRATKFEMTPEDASSDNPLAAGNDAPSFSIPDLNGKSVSLSDFKGKYVFIDFWASWCAPCIAQIPHLLAINEMFRKKNFVMLGVSLDSHKDAWTKAIEKHKLKNIVHVSNLKGWSEPVAVTFGVKAIPANVLIGPDGKIVAKNLGKESLETTLSELIK